MHQKRSNIDWKCFPESSAMTDSSYSIVARFFILFSLRIVTAVAESSTFTNSEVALPPHGVLRSRATFSEIISVLQFPNPLKDPARCGLNDTVASTLLCDPEAVLGDAERLALHERLKRLEEATADPHAEDVCHRKGVRVGIAITQRPLAITHPPFALSVNGPGVENVAQYLLHRGWSLDRQCHRSAVIVYANLGQRFIFERDTAMPVFADEMDFLIATESAMKRISVFQAFDNLLSSIEEVAERRAAGRDGLGGSRTDAATASLNRANNGGWWTVTYLSMFLFVALLVTLVVQIVVVCATQRRFAALAVEQRRLHHARAVANGADGPLSLKAISLATHIQQPFSEAEK